MSQKTKTVIIDGMTYKECYTCPKENNLHVLNKDNFISYNEKYYSSQCRICLNKQAREKYKENKKPQDPNKKIANKLRRSVSVCILNYLNKSNNKHKFGQSLFLFLPYSIEQLKSHIESQFEPWMNWNNFKKYNAKWNDSDSSTWTWQVSHIYPHIYFNYDSPQDEEFQKCWALDNLRPLSSKQHIISDGNKKCSQCGKIRSNTEFYYERFAFRSECKKCNEENRNKLTVKQKIKERDKKYNKKRLENYYKNKSKYAEKQKEYRNRDDIKQKHKIYYSDRAKRLRLTSPLFNLRGVISRLINNGLKRNKSSKQGKSITKYLPYTVHELKQHLESQFEPWMNWNNWGVYRCEKWDDNDSSTWTWQLDHIIPHSEFNYTSMDDENFKKCWALENLRPLSAKRNLLEGTRRTRHKKAA
jgi:hypothetical protein